MRKEGRVPFAKGREDIMSCDETGKYEVLKPLHRALLMMLEDFSRICDENNLRWYAHYGTAIGALREGGFIPWDEDVDICMSRADLDALTRIVQDSWADKYQMINAQIDPSYPMMTYRMMLKGTHMADTALASMNFTSMIFLDLFPLDDLADDQKLFDKQVKHAWLNNKIAMAKLTPHPYVKDDGLRSKVLLAGSAVLRGLLHLPGLNRIDFNAKSLAWCTKYQGQNTKRVGFVCDTTPLMDVYQRSDFEPARMIPFEDTVLPFPAQVEKHLTDLYGDYMKPIDASQRDEHFPDILELGPYAERFGASK